MDRLRRDLCFALPSVLASSCALASAKDTLPSKIYQFDELPVRSAGNLIFRAILDGMILEGCHYPAARVRFGAPQHALPAAPAPPRRNGVCSGRHAGVYR